MLGGACDGQGQGYHCKSTMACRRKAPPGYGAAPRANFAVTAIRLLSLTQLRTCGAARFACLQGKALRLSPPRRAWRPLNTAEPAAPDRPTSWLQLRLGDCREHRLQLLPHLRQKLVGLSRALARVGQCQQRDGMHLHDLA